MRQARELRRYTGVVPASWSHTLSTLAIVWSLVAALSAFRAARTQPADPMARLEAEFRQLVLELPPSGVVGYLGHYVDDGADLAVRTHYAAQYALAPRVIPNRTGTEFLIVAAGNARPDGDPRLAGYVQVARTAAGHRLFRRFPR